MRFQDMRGGDNLCHLKEPNQTSTNSIPLSSRPQTLLPSGHYDEETEQKASQIFQSPADSHALLDFLQDSGPSLGSLGTPYTKQVASGGHGTKCLCGCMSRSPPFFLHFYFPSHWLLTESFSGFERHLQECREQNGDSEDGDHVICFALSNTFFTCYWVKLALKGIKCQK